MKVGLTYLYLDIVFEKVELSKNKHLISVYNLLTYNELNIVKR